MYYGGKIYCRRRFVGMDMFPKGEESDAAPFRRSSGKTIYNQKENRNVLE
jgi:hypothetical protein